MNYEFHVTIDKSTNRWPDWKQTTFLNVDINGNTLREDILLTANRDFYDILEASTFLHTIILMHGATNILRAKIETPANRDRYSTLYYEAHMKIDKWYNNIDFPYALKSINKNTGANWVTIRNEDYQHVLEIYRQTKAHMFSQGITILEQEIESVIFDTNPGIDLEWEIGMLGK